MSSQVRYRFKNAVAEDSVAFDGAVIQIGDIKRLIALKRGLGADGAAELTLFDAGTSEEHTDDSKVVPRNTLVLVKRAPATKFKPLSSAAGGAVQHPPASTAPSAAPANGQQTAAAADEFGGDYYSDKPTPAVVREEEERALASRLAGAATDWQREVRQGMMRGRGRGRGGGGTPYDYRCPRCEAVGQHWVQECPTQGDPAYDKKRVRPPVGIPMTRLARSEEGGLVLPGGQTGTLIANEDAFAREILGLPTGAPTAAQQAQQQQAGAAAAVAAAGAGAPEDAKAPLLLLDSKPAAEAAAAAIKAEPGTAAAAAIPAAGLAPNAPPVGAQPVVQPLLAGEAELTGAAPFSSMPGASFFSMFMQSALLPRGPPDFLRSAFDRAEPMSRTEFERSQDDLLARYHMAANRRQEPPARRPLPLRARSPPRRQPSREPIPVLQRSPRGPISQRSPPRVVSQRSPVRPVSQRSPPRDRSHAEHRPSRSRERRRSRSLEGRRRSRSKERSSKPRDSKDADKAKEKSSKSSLSEREERSHRSSKPEREKEESRRKRSRTRSRERSRDRRRRREDKGQGLPKEDERWQPAAEPPAAAAEPPVAPAALQPQSDSKAGDVRLAFARKAHRAPSRCLLLFVFRILTTTIDEPHISRHPLLGCVATAWQALSCGDDKELTACSCVWHGVVWRQLGGGVPAFTAHAWQPHRRVFDTNSLVMMAVALRNDNTHIADRKSVV